MEKKEIEKYRKKIFDIKAEIKKAILGQDEVIDSVLKCFICNGHVLLEGVPGIAKTFLVRCLSKTIKNSQFNRVQFTPDLLPSDIIGIEAYSEKKGFHIEKGPVFANFILADEINRAPPKVQSAMLEAMQEKMVTIGKETFELPKPFLVLATQNPLEQMGVYPLPEAQIDRFLFKVLVYYPNIKDEVDIIESNSTLMSLEDYGIKEILEPKDVIKIQNIVKQIHLSHKIKEYIVNIVDATRHPDKYEVEEGKYVDFGGSPRACIALGIAAKADAFLKGQEFVMPENVRAIAKEVLRHRILLNYEGKAMNVKQDDIIEKLLSKVPVP